MPTTVEELEKLSWGQLLYLAGEHAEALGINGADSPLLSRRHPPHAKCSGGGAGSLAGSQVRPCRNRVADSYG